MLTISNEFENNARRWLSGMKHYDLRDEIKLINEVMQIEHIETSMLFDEIMYLQEYMRDELVNRFLHEDFMCHSAPGQVCEEMNECELVPV